MGLLKTFQHALADKNHDLLLARLEDSRPEPEALRLVLMAEDPVLSHALFLHIRRRVKAPEADDSRQPWELLLPASLSGLALETQLVIAELLLLLPRSAPWPAWPPLEQYPLLRVACLRAEIVRDPERLGDIPSSAALFWAVREIPLEHLPAPLPPLSALLTHESAAVQEQGLRYLKEALHQGLLQPSSARGLLEQALSSPHPQVVSEALKALRSPWASLLPCPTRALSALLERGAFLAREAVPTLARWEQTETLLSLLAEDSLDPRVQIEALRALARWGRQEHIGPLLACAARDPLSFGEEAAKTLQTLRRRGISCSPKEAEEILSLYEESPKISPRVIAEILSSQTAVCLRVIEKKLRPDQEGARWISLLEALGSRPALDALRSLLSSEAMRRHWGEAILALGRMERQEAEEELLARLTEEPEACLTALGSMGGARTVARLRALFSSGEEERPPWFPRALAILFTLDPSLENLTSTQALGVLSPEILAALPASLCIAQAEILKGIAQKPRHPLREESISALGRTGGVLALDALYALLDDPEEEVRQAAREALRALGIRLYQQRSARPACLSQARSDKEAAELALTEGLLRRLTEKDLREEQLHWLLDPLIEIGRSSHTRLIQTLRRFLRHKSPHVKKRALQCLGGCAGPDASAWILPFTETQDIYLLRQALGALGKLGASWVAESLARGLSHPNMNIKKTAAAALIEAGDTEVVPSLLRWLGYHDNPGLRADLIQALQRILGDGYAITLFAALEKADSMREAELLIQALDGVLYPSWVARAAANALPWAGLLVQKLYDGAIKLAKGDLKALDSALRRRGVAQVIPAERLHQSADELSALLWEQRGSPEVLPALLAALSRVGAEESPSVLPPGMLREHLKTLLLLYPRVQKPAREAILALLRAGSSIFCERERFRVSQTLRTIPPREHPEGFLALLAYPGAVLSVEQARLLLETGQEQALETLLLSEPPLSELEALPRRLQERVVEHLIASGAHEQLLAQQHQGGQLGALLTKRLWEQRPQWYALLPPGLDRAYRESLLLASEGEDQATRVEAARALLSWADASLRQRILQKYLDGKLGEIPPGVSLTLSLWELRVFLRALEESPDAFDDGRLLRLAKLAARARNKLDRVPLLLSIWKAGKEASSASARSALCAHLQSDVLPFVLSSLKEGRWSYLEILPSARRPEPGLLQLWTASDLRGRSQLLRFFAREALAGPLYAPGLGGDLLSGAESEGLSPLLLNVLASLTDWYEPKEAEKLALSLGRLLQKSPEATDAVLGALLGGLSSQPAALQARLLGSLGKLSVAPSVLQRLAEVHLRDPQATRGLPEGMQSAIRKRIVSLASDKDPEKARMALAYLVTEPDEAALRLLEGALSHRARRVRLQALRLLRSYAPRERYLNAARSLLEDKDPDVIRQGVRILAFGGDPDAAQDIVALLHHANPKVRSVAKEGLLDMGTSALFHLKRALSRARPDRRASIEAVLTELEKRRGA